MMIAAFCIKALAVTVLTTMSKPTSGLEKELDVRSQAFSVMNNNINLNNHTETMNNIMVNDTVQMVEPTVSPLSVTPTITPEPHVPPRFKKMREMTQLRRELKKADLLKQQQAAIDETLNSFRFTSSIAAAAMKEIETMKHNQTTVFTFSPNVSIVNETNNLGFINETNTGNELLMEPPATPGGRIVDLFRSTSQVVRETFHTFLGDTDLLLDDSLKINVEPSVKNISDHVLVSKNISRLSSDAPINVTNVTHDGNLTKNATLMVNDNGNITDSTFGRYLSSADGFVEDYVLAPSRRSISLASGVYDTISVDAHLAYNELDFSYEDFLADPSRAGEMAGKMVVKTVADTLEQVYNKVERKITDLFTPPPPTLEQALQREAMALAKLVDRKISQCQRTRARVEVINGWLPRPVAVADIQFWPEVKCVVRWL